ncbi:hypothetical protein C3492_05420 [Streptomyces sp. Ru62]|uniref:hypothetical protein n=1 Tax=Streptomyces sp. Ru62 TaxID=2080745 RepID=UPI000CDD83B9|nr:hypothetical protein [Streptomyces sp. Ru62]POX64473.1 hypothetical protein C3492_05420 [Streptomyces sp. Ru62]
MTIFQSAPTGSAPAGPGSRPVLAPDALVIDGGVPLTGDVTVDGHKHSMVLVFAAALALGTRVTIDNVPAVSERDILLEQLRLLGCSARVSGRRVVLDTVEARPGELRPELTRKVHGSLYLMPAMLARFGEVLFPGAGGDHLGSYEHGQGRPIAQMLEVLEQFGCRFRTSDDGTVHGWCAERHGARPDIMGWSSVPGVLRGPRVSSATKAALIFAATVPETSVVRHPLLLWATRDLLDFLVAAGVRVTHTADGVAVCGRPARAVPASVSLLPDPCEAATWMACAASTGGRVRVLTEHPQRLRAAMRHELAVFDRLGLPVRWDADGAVAEGDRAELRPATVVAVNDGPCTDALPLFTPVMLRAAGTSVVRDAVWSGRYHYAEQLRRLGARLEQGPDQLVVHGGPLRAADAPLTPGDTRAAAVTVLAALATHGRSVITGTEHLHRGYAHMPEKLTRLGARVMSAVAEAA